MFRNLNAEQARYDLTNDQMATRLGMTRKTYETKKATGNFTYHEIRKLLKMFNLKQIIMKITLKANKTMNKI